MPKSVQPKAKGAIREIWQAETKADALTAFDHFLEKYDAKYQKACDCLRKDREQLLTFYDFPAEHWAHLRTTNPIESTFATIRLRRRKTKDNGTRRTSLAMFGALADRLDDVQAGSVCVQEMEPFTQPRKDHTRLGRTLLPRRNPAGIRRLKNSSEHNI